MALGSGSSLATGFWMRRKGFPSSDQLLKVGKASRLHQHSSQKPTAQVSELASATSISRSLAHSPAISSFVEGIGRCNPSLDCEPSHSEEVCQSRPDGLPRDPSLCVPLLDAHLSCHLKRPEATIPAELPRRAVQHLPHSLGALLIEG